MLRIRNLRTKRSLNCIATAVILMVCGIILSQVLSDKPAEAIGSYRTSELASHALRFLNQPGGNACSYVGKPGGSECKQFVNCIIYAVSGRAQYPAPGYNSGFRNAGGIEISRLNAQRGDIIQVGGDEAVGPELHTAIVLNNYGNGSFNVVDSNYNWAGTVKQHDYTPPAYAKFWRMGLPDRRVIGSLDSVQRVPGGILAQGWSIDEDTASSNQVHVYSGDGSSDPTKNPGATGIANGYRSDVANVYPAYGGSHGYAIVVRAKAARNQKICSYGINVSGTLGTNALLGCKDMSISADPYGSLDGIRRVEGGVLVTGWAIDPDTGEPIGVHIYGGLGGVGQGPGVATTANLYRADIGAAYPHYGSNHGYSVVLKTSSEPQTFCAYGINNGAGGYNPQLACKRA